MTGLFAVWAIVALFTGTGEYLTTFVAQYFGAGRRERIGAAIWQGIYFSVGGGRLHRAAEPARGTRASTSRATRRCCAATRSSTPAR